MNEITSLGQTHVHEYYFPTVAGRNFAKYYWTGSAWETDYMHGNPLGSSQVVTRSDNSLLEAEVFYPFGGLRWRGGGTQDVRFAGMQERDGETTSWQDPLYPTPNRLYTSGLGRWLSPDPAGKGAAQLQDPQTWNMYAYVRNNPTTLTDPTGLLLAQPSLVMALQALAHASEANKKDDSEEKRQGGEGTPDDQTDATASQREAPPNKGPTQGEGKDSQGTQSDVIQTSPRQFKGDATYYDLPGSKTASGQRFDPHKMAGAMTGEKAELGQTVTVTYSYTDQQGKTVTRSVSVVINDRGPFARDGAGRPIHPYSPDPRGAIDLTPRAFRELVGTTGRGRVPVTVTVPARAFCPVC